jgi:hypothetical protein
MLATAGLAGGACGVFVMGLVDRLATGPLPDAAAAARSLRFLESATAGVFLLLLALLVRRR